MDYGIMGGTFDPIHLGHLFIAQETLEKLGLDKVLFIPNGNPPHKETRISEKDRYLMVKDAISDNPFFEVSDIELFKNKSSYTIDTLSTLKSLNPNDNFYFIIGSDSALAIQTWKNYEKIFSLCTIVCIRRPGFDISEMIIDEKLSSQMIFADSILLDISSTDIRRRIALKKSIRYLVRESTEKYIESKNLYRREL